MRFVTYVGFLLIAGCSSSSTPEPNATTGTAADGGSDGGSTQTAADASTTPPPAGDGTGNACGQTNATTGEQLCAACINLNCCTEIQACAADADCKNLQLCLTRCQPSDQACVGACQNLSPAGVTKYNSESNCSSLKCSGQPCTSPPPGCSNVALGETGQCSQTPFPLVWICPNGAPEPQCVASPNGKADWYCCLQ